MTVEQSDPGSVGATVGWGLLGTGAVSHSVAADLRAVVGARRTAVWSRNEDNAKRFAEQHDIGRHVGSVAELLSDPEVGLVYIATPHATHAPLAVAAIEAGKHVLIEKPIGVDASEARAIEAAARANDRFAMEAMWMKFSPAYLALLSEISAGVFGEVSAVRASFGLPFGSPGSRRWNAELRSSTLLDQAVYAVTLARDVLGEPSGMTSGATVRPDGVDLSLHATLEFPGGQFAQLAASMVTYLEPTASVSGSAGWATLAAPFWATDRFRRHTGDLGEALMQPTEHVSPSEGEGYGPMLRAVQSAVVSGARGHATHPLSDSIAVMAILDEIRSTWSTPTH